MLSVWSRVAGERPRHYKYQSLNEHTSVVREAMERRSAPSPARPGPGPGATRDRHYNGTGLQPPPPRLPRRRPPGAHTRNRAASSVDIMVPLTAFF